MRSRSRFSRRILAAILLLHANAASVSAHDVPPTFLDLSVTPHGLVGTVIVGNDFILQAAALPPGPPFDRRTSFNRRDSLVERALLPLLELHADGTALEPRLTGARGLERDTTYLQTTVELIAPWVSVPKRLHVRCRLFPPERGHAAVFSLRGPDGENVSFGRLHNASDSIEILLPDPPERRPSRRGDRPIGGGLVALGIVVAAFVARRYRVRSSK